MPSVKFFLKDPKSKEPTLIYLIFQFNYYEIINGKKRFKFFKYYTGEKILPAYWNQKSNKARDTKNFSASSDLNNRLSDLEKLVLKIHTRIINDGLKPTPDLIREKVKQNIGQGNIVNVEKIDLFTFIQQIIDDSKLGKRTTEQGRRINIFTTKGYTTTLNHLKEFQKDYHRKIDFDTIDLDFYDDFVNFFMEENYATNSIGNHIKNLKMFMRAALEKKLHTNIDFQNRRFKKLEEQTDSIYLNDDEILKIYKLDLSDNPTLEKIRDLFIVGCYTGLRFSDYHRITPENIKKRGKGTFLQVKTQKTVEPVVIPMNWMLEELTKKYKSHFPKPYTNQEMNRELKIIGKKAKIKEKVSLSKTKGGLRVDVTDFKYDLITTHTARRSFATNMYLAGIPSISIMKITGHRTEKSFLRYIKISQEDNAYKLLEHPYFKQSRPAKLKKV